jgi:mannose-6-phosphate isomerase
MNTVAQLLPRNHPEHFYRGGERIAALRGGSVEEGARRPEEWIASMTPMTSRPDQGLSRLAGGALLRDAVAADPEGWLGAAHVARYGASTELLVKLLDPAQRLPVHLHPDRAFARRHLGLPHGKTEAWIVLEVDEGARVRLGFTSPMRLADVRAMVDGGDSDGLVKSLRTRAVRPGDAVLVPAGVPHSIDPGVFLLELQEPTDLSILLEAEGMAVDVPRDGHLGLGFDVALDALRLEPIADLDALVTRPDTVDPGRLADLMPAAAGPYFRAHLSTDDSGPSVTAGFAVVVGTAGAGRLVPTHGDPVALGRGDAAVVPFAAGEWRLDGPVEAVVCRPPLPSEPPSAPHDRANQEAQ